MLYHFSSVVSDSLQPHALKHARPPCPSPTPRAYSNSFPFESVMPSNHLSFCHPPLLPPSIFPSIRVFSDESVLCIRWPKFWSFSTASTLPMNTQDCSPLGWTGWNSLQSKGLSRDFSNTTVQKHQFFGAQFSLYSNSHIHAWLLGKSYLWLDRPLLAKKCLWFLICCLGWS